MLILILLLKQIMCQKGRFYDMFYSYLIVRDGEIEEIM